MINLLGAEHVLFGSDYLHSEGLRLRRDFVPLLDGCEQPKSLPQGGFTKATPPSATTRSVRKLVTARCARQV